MCTQCRGEGTIRNLISLYRAYTWLRNAQYFSLFFAVICFDCFLKKYVFIYLFIFGGVPSSLSHEGFL